VTDFDLRDDFSVLGMESRSILKSIQTEEAKLVQSQHLTRSDLHYFKARHNYYRLSLLRLPSDERSLLEPSLGRFFEKISRFESREGASEEKAPPFIHSVDKRELLKALEPMPEPLSQKTKSLENSLGEEILSQLQLIRLALTGDVSSESKKVLCDGVDRIISRLKDQPVQR
jgi:hypothetical protein